MMAASAASAFKTGAAWHKRRRVPPASATGTGTEGGTETETGIET